MTQPVFADARAAAAGAFAYRIAVQLDFGSDSDRALLVQAFVGGGGSAVNITSCTVGGTISGGTTTGTVGVAGTKNVDGTISGGTSLTMETQIAGPSFVGTVGTARAARLSSGVPTGVQWVQIVCDTNNGKPAIIASAASGVSGVNAGSSFTGSSTAVSISVSSTADDLPTALFFASIDDSYTASATSPTVQRRRGLVADADSGYNSFAWEETGASGTVALAGSITGTFTPAWAGTAWNLAGVASAGPTITGPSGAAGAGSITTSAAENQNVAGVWTATNSATWSLSGTDAGLLSISGGTVTKTSGNFDFEAKPSYSFTVNNGSASQAVTLNINDVNEAPSFIGPAIGSLVLTQGVAMTPVDIAAKFTDPEGLGITASVVESLPAGLSVVSGILQGTPSVVQGSASYTPRGADPASNGTNGTAFTITVLSPIPALSAPSASATGTTTATAGFTTSLAGGNAFFLRRTGASPASQATVATTGESQAVSASGAQTRNMTGFTTGTPFYVDMTQTGASDVVSAGPFTPSTMTTSGSPSAQSGTAGAAFSYTGGTPASFISGGIGTKTWSLISAGGSGLSSVNPSTGVPAGTLTGTPGTYSPVLRVTDSSTAGINPTGGGAPPQTIDFTLTLIVGASGAATAIVISNASPANGQVGQLSNDFTVGANGAITGTVAVTPNAGAGGGSFVPSSVNISSGSPTGTFKYLPASTGAKSIGVTNNGGLTNPSTVTYTATPALATTLSVTLTTDGITPLPNLTGLKVAVYDQPTPDLWAGNPPIYATAAGSTDAFGVLTCNIAGLTTLVPGGLAGLSISNSDGTLTQGAAQRGYVGPAAVS